MNALAIDYGALRIVTDGDPEIEHGLFQLYFQTARQCIDRLNRTAEQAGDGWDRAVHELKGASANMHLPGMVEFCTQAEQETTPGERRHLLALLESEVQRVRAASKTTKAQA